MKVSGFQTDYGTALRGYSREKLGGWDGGVPGLK